MSDMEKMTIKSQEAMQAAARSAETKNNPEVQPEHLMAELVQQRGGIIPRVLEKMNANVIAISSGLEERIKRLKRESM